MKNKFLSIFVGITLIFCFVSCTSLTATSRNRQLFISGLTLSETDFGGVERWYAVNEYDTDHLISKVLFQVGYFLENEIGFVLYEDGTKGEEAYFSRQGLNLRWDWGSNGYGTNYKYCFIIEPDGTGLYYDFSLSKDGTAKPKGIYKVHKF